MPVTIGKYTFPDTELNSMGLGAGDNGEEVTATIMSKTDAVEEVAEVLDPESGDIITQAVAAVPAMLKLSDGTDWSEVGGGWTPVPGDDESKVQGTSSEVDGGRRSRRQGGSKKKSKGGSKKKMSKGWGGSKKKKQKKRKGSKKRR